MTTLVGNIIDHCRSLGIELSPTDRGVKCSAPSGTMTPGLQTIIKAKRHEIHDALIEEVTAFDKCLNAKFSDEVSNQSRTAVSWPVDVGYLADLVLLLTAEDLPAAPFNLCPGRIVVDTAKFLRTLHGDIRRGADGPRARLGSLQSDLHFLRNILLDDTSSTDV